jgi:hypothetical protein
MMVKSIVVCRHYALYVLVHACVHAYVCYATYHAMYVLFCARCRSYVCMLASHASVCKVWHTNTILFYSPYTGINVLTLHTLGFPFFCAFETLPSYMQ